MLTEAIKSYLKTNLEFANQEFDRFSRKYFPKLVGKYEKPTIKIKDIPNGMGRYEYNDVTNVIVIDPDVMNNMELLKSVVWHEAIHYYNIQQLVEKDPDVDLIMMDKMDGFHNAFFKHYMDLINRKEGKEMIFIKGVFPQGKTVSPIYLYGSYRPFDRVLKVFTQNKIDPATIEWLEKSKELSPKNKYFYFETDELELKNIKMSKMYKNPKTGNKRPEYTEISPNEDGEQKELYNRLYNLITQKINDKEVTFI